MRKERVHSSSGAPVARMFVEPAFGCATIGNDPEKGEARSTKRSQSVRQAIDRHLVRISEHQNDAVEIGADGARIGGIFETGHVDDDDAVVLAQLLNGLAQCREVPISLP